MLNVIITGATGMIGSIILRECLQNDEIGSVTALVRKTTDITHDKLKEVVVTDYSDLETHAECFKGQHIAYYCLGVYTGAVPRKKFKEITVDYTHNFAMMLKKHSPNATFCFMSGMGADRTEKSVLMFAKYKGAAENILLDLNFKQMYIFRPAYIYPVNPRKEPNLAYKLMRWLYPISNRVYPNGVVSSEQLGQAMFTVGLCGANKIIFENKDIKNYKYVYG